VSPIRGEKANRKFNFISKGVAIGKFFLEKFEKNGRKVLKPSGFQDPAASSPPLLSIQLSRMTIDSFKGIYFPEKKIKRSKKYFFDLF